MSDLGKQAHAQGRRGSDQQKVHPVPAIPPTDSPQRGSGEQDPGRQQDGPVTDRPSERTSEIGRRPRRVRRPDLPAIEAVAHCRRDSRQADGRRGAPGPLPRSTAPTAKDPGQRQTSSQADGHQREPARDSSLPFRRRFESEPQPRCRNALRGSEFPNPDCLQGRRHGLRRVVPNGPPDAVMPQSERRRDRQRVGRKAVADYQSPSALTCAHVDGRVERDCGEAGCLVDTAGKQAIERQIVPQP